MRTSYFGMASRSISTRTTRNPARSTSLIADEIAVWSERAERVNCISIPSAWPPSDPSVQPASPMRDVKNPSWLNLDER